MLTCLLWCDATIVEIMYRKKVDSTMRFYGRFVSPGIPLPCHAMKKKNQKMRAQTQKTLAFPVNAVNIRAMSEWCCSWSKAFFGQSRAFEGKRDILWQFCWCSALMVKFRCCDCEKSMFTASLKAAEWASACLNQRYAIARIKKG